MFRLTKDETDYVRSRSQIATLNDGDSTDPSSLRSQFATSNKGRGGVRYLPYSFTELGVARYRPTKAQPRSWRAGRRWGGRPRARTSALSGIRGSRLCRSLWGLPGTCTRDAARQRL